MFLTSRIVRPSLRPYLAALAFCLGTATAQPPPAREAGIPVTDALVISKCSTCHARDEQGNLERISWVRTTPEGWQNVLKRMIGAHGLSVSTAEARAILRYLASGHGLAPGEARATLAEAERRTGEENKLPTESLTNACTKCHGFARALTWRRSAEAWQQHAEAHTADYHVARNAEAVAYLTKAAPLHTPEWDAWAARKHELNLAGRWLITAWLPGHGAYYGDMTLEPAGGDEFTTTIHLTSINDGSTLTRTGRSALYGANAWRGRSTDPNATPAPGAMPREMREVLWLAPDQATAEGRWFWGQYQEFGFDVQLRRDQPGPTLLALNRTALKAGSKGNRLRLIVDHLPGQLKPADLDFGPGITVRGIVSSKPNEVEAEVDVAPSASLGRRSVAIQLAALPAALAIYDRVDYVKISPESAVAAFSDRAHPPGYQPFDAIGYNRGADGKLRTADDVKLDPVEVTWSLEVFYATPGSDPAIVGVITPNGLFTPAPQNPERNFDTWAVATAKAETDAAGKPLIAKSYLVVTVPTYTFNGRRYVRELGRWVDDGPAPTTP